MELFIPSVIHKAPAHAKQGASSEPHTDLITWTVGRDDWQGTALEIITEQTHQAVRVYETLLESGVAPEEARIVLPLNTMVSWIWTGSLLAFNRVYQQRVDSHAQITGTQEFAHKLGSILYEHFPHSMEALNS